jgi:hypothetical protein
MSLARHLMTTASGRARGDSSAQVGIDWAKRLVRLAEQGQRINREELSLARRIVAAARNGEVH